MTLLVVDRRIAIHDMFLLGVLPPYTTSRDWVWDQRVSQFQELLRILKLTRSAIPLSSVGDLWHGASPDLHLWLMNPDPDPTPFISDINDPPEIFSHIFFV